MKFKIGDVLIVDGIVGRIVDVKLDAGELDYHLEPVNFPTTNFCKCGEDHCEGLAWYLEDYLEKHAVRK